MPSLRQMPAEDVSRSRHCFVNKPGDFEYTFTVHAVTELGADRVRIDYGGTHVVCPRSRLVVIIDEPDRQ